MPTAFARLLAEQVALAGRVGRRRAAHGRLRGRHDDRMRSGLRPWSAWSAGSRRRCAPGRSPTPPRWPRRSPCSSRFRAGRTPDGQQGPHRQPRRDRGPHPARLPRPRAAGGRRLQRGGSRLARGSPGRRGDLHRPGGGTAQLSEPAGGHQRRNDHRLRRGPSRIRLPLRGRDVRRGVRRPRPDLHRPAARGARAVRQQVRGAPHARRQRPADGAGQPRHRHRPVRRARAGGRGRLPGAPEAVGRWRGSRHAPDPLTARDGDLAATGALRGAGGIRRRQHLLREVDRGVPARRGAGHGRSARQRHPPRRARLQRSAPASEDHRGGPVTGDGCRQPRAAARPRHPQRRGRRIRGCRDPRVPARRGRQLLLHRDQLPDPGRAPGDRDADRRRPDRGADPRRRRRRRSACGRTRSPCVGTRSSSG